MEQLSDRPLELSRPLLAEVQQGRVEGGVLVRPLEEVGQPCFVGEREGAQAGGVRWNGGERPVEREAHLEPQGVPEPERLQPGRERGRSEAQRRHFQLEDGEAGGSLRPFEEKAERSREVKPRQQEQLPLPPRGSEGRPENEAGGFVLGTDEQLPGESTLADGDRLGVLGLRVREQSEATELRATDLEQAQRLERAGGGVDEVSGGGHDVGVDLGGITVLDSASSAIDVKWASPYGPEMAAKRRAVAVWEHDLLKGHGRFKVDSGAIPELPISWAARTEQSGGKTSPEELLAAAHASCFAMAFSAGLGRMGKPPERLTVSAVCTFDKVGDGFKVTTMELDVVGKVPGMDAAAFQEAAKKAEAGCPISGALRNNVEIRLTAKLE